MSLTGIELSLVQGSPEWHAYRQKRIGASDIPTILGENPYMDAEGLWRVKLGYDEIFETEAMRRGRRLEPVALNLFSKKKNRLYLPAVYRHPHEPWAMASLDGISGDDICEIKTCTEYNHSYAVEGCVPPHYYGQLQWQMLITGATEVDYVSYCWQNEDLKVVNVKEDKEYQDKAFTEANLFFAALFFGDEEGVSALPAHMRREEVYKVDDLYFADLVSDYKKICAKIKNLESEKNALKSKFLKMSEGKQISGFGLTVKRCFMPGKVRLSCIPELEGVDLDMYREAPKEVWRINLSKE